MHCITTFQSTMNHIWWWAHKIIMNYKQKACSLCWKMNILPAMGGLNRRGGSPDLGPGEAGRRGVHPLPSPHAHLCAQTHFPSLSFSLWLLSHPYSLPPSFSSSLFSPSLFYYFWAQALSLVLFQSLLSLSLPFSTFPLSLPSAFYKTLPLPPSLGTGTHSLYLLYWLYFDYTFSMFSYV